MRAISCGLKIVVLLVSLLAGRVSAAAVVVEAGDAGQSLTTAQDVTAQVGLDEIQGSFSSGLDVDLYRIFIDDPSGFSASTVGGTALDTQLFLFTTGGKAVIGNDDYLLFSVIQIPQSQLGVGSASSLSPGEYLLGISLFDVDPVNAIDQEIFQDNPVLIMGVAVPDPFDRFVSATSTGPEDPSEPGYSIYLTGVQSGSATAAVPEPGTLTLSLLGLAGCGWLRRRAG